jgi:TonB family protein
VSSRLMQQCLASVLLALAVGATTVGPLPAFAQEELARKVKSKVAPIYPDIARRMSISGTVKLVVVVGTNGNVKSTKPLGGHPVLIGAAMDAMKKWKFEPAADESTGVVEFKFQPQD